MQCRNDEKSEESDLLSRKDVKRQEELQEYNLGGIKFVRTPSIHTSSCVLHKFLFKSILYVL